ncbi:MAG: arsenate reductase ArsC [Planctomycetota bacterium]
MKLLFLCTGNSCRSQMAEGWARQLKAGTIEAFSAGIETHGLNPYAVRAMAEAGVDISGQESQTVADIAAAGGPTVFDVVVTVCGHADEHCPRFAGAPRIIHRPFDDPPRLAASITDEAEKMAPYRRVRDEIRAFVAGLPQSLEGPAFSDPPL